MSQQPQPPPQQPPQILQRPGGQQPSAEHMHQMHQQQMTQQQQHEMQMKIQHQQQHGRGPPPHGQGRGPPQTQGGRSPQGRGPPPGRGNQGGRQLYQGGRGRGQQHGRGGPPQGRGGPQPTSLNPSSGIPYGHVPAYLPGSASLVEQLDQRVLLVLRDGKHIIGELASFDQFSNMIVQEAVERRFHHGTKGTPETYYCDIPLGVYVVRGDSVVILGNIQDQPASNLKEVSLEELQQMKEEATKGEEDEFSGPLTWDFDVDLIA